MISEELVKRSLALIASSPANYEYFYAKLMSPDWIEPLWKAGRLQNPPPAKRDDTTISFPPWAESHYLARMAKEAPELVKNVILAVKETDNQRVHQDFVEAALQMPGPISAKIADAEAAWIRKQNALYILYPDKVAELIAYLAERNEDVTARRLARTLLTLSPDPRSGVRIGEGEDSFELPKEPRSKFDDWHYQRSLQIITAPLVTAGGPQGLQLFCDLLEQAVKIHSGTNGAKDEDYSWIWRPRIEGEGHGDPKDSLTSAVRDAALQLSVDAAGLSGTIRHLVSRRWRIFRRIAAYVLTKAPNVSSNSIVEFLTATPFRYEYPSMLPEVPDLLKDSFARLNEEDRRPLLESIEAGPDLEQYRSNFEAREKCPPSEDEVQKFVDYWRLQWLDPISENLSAGWMERYTELVGRFGKPTEQQSHRGVFVGPTSPKTAEELGKLEPEELIEYLKTWTPSREWASPTPAGLGRELTTLVSVRPDLSALAERFIGLDPTYVSSAIEGLREAVQKGKAIDWPKVLNLCGWVIERPVEIPGRKVDLIDADLDWMAARIAVARLINEGVRTDKAARIPGQFRSSIWGLLTTIVSGRDPNAKKDQGYGENSWAGSLSLNTPRGIALDAVVSYAVWVSETSPAAKEGGSRLELAPEARELLETHFREDTSLAAREVYGLRFPTLVWLDREWASQNIELIFKREKTFSDRVAWINYVLFSQAHDELLPLLQSQYEEAINSLAHPLTSSLQKEVARAVVHHLVSFFWRGRIDFADPKSLLAQFFRLASVEMRAYGIETIGRGLSDSVKEGDFDNLLERLRNLLKTRLEIIEKAGKRDLELEPFGWWFISGAFDDDWAIQNLLNVLRVTHKVSPDWLVVKLLAELVRSKPVESVEALERIVTGDQEGYAIYGWEDYPRKILESALKSDSAAARESAVRVIHLMGYRGQYALRDLLRTHVP